MRKRKDNFSEVAREYLDSLKHDMVLQHEYQKALEALKAEYEAKRKLK